MKKMKKNRILATFTATMATIAGFAQTPVTIHSQNTQPTSVDAYDIEGFVFERVEEEQASAIDEWIDLGLPSGTLWRSANFGAGYPAASGTYIPYEAWKENDNDYLARLTDYSMRTPGVTEINELFANCSVEKDEIEGVMGVKLTGPNGNSIFIPAAGIHYTDDSTLWRNMLCPYWAYNPHSSAPIEVATLNVERPDKMNYIEADVYYHPLGEYYDSIGRETPGYCLCLRPIKDTITDVIYDCREWPSFEVGNDNGNTALFEVVASKMPVISCEDDYVSWEITEGEEVGIPEAFDGFFSWNSKTLNEPFRKWIVTFTLLPNTTSEWRHTSVIFKGKRLPWGVDARIDLRQAPN